MLLLLQKKYWIKPITVAIAMHIKKPLLSLMSSVLGMGYRSSLSAGRSPKTNYPLLSSLKISSEAIWSVTILHMMIAMAEFTTSTKGYIFPKIAIKLLFPTLGALISVS